VPPSALLDPFDLAAEVGDEHVGDRGHVSWRGDPEGDSGLKALEVAGASGEGHRRVQRERASALVSQWSQDGEAVRARGVSDDLAGPDHVCGRQLADHSGERVIGYRDDQDVASRGRDLDRRQQARLGKQRRDAMPRDVG
jgi:hypothetical protein